MRSAHEKNAQEAVEYIPEVMIRIVPRVKNSSLADEAPEAVSDENKGSRGRIAKVPVVCEVAKKVLSVVDQPIRRDTGSADYVCIVAVGKDSSLM
jgi:hypothetical protein